MKILTIILSGILMIAAPQDGAKQYWDTVLQKYEALCNACLNHISTSFEWQVWINLPIVARTICPAYGFIHIARATVVGSYDQIPVAIDAVKVFQILCCGVC